MSNFKKHVSTINPVGAVLDVGSADEVQWSDASDVVVVGWGGQVPVPRLRRASRGPKFW
ncbi:MAG: hypothetical protein L0H10_18455 [Comamonas sp.]|nr:hypothetical protein [Comamonas sp.]